MWQTNEKMKNINIKELNIKEIDGIYFLNVSPHEFRGMKADDEVVTIPQSGLVVSAKPREQLLYTKNGIEFFETIFDANEEIKENLKELKETFESEGKMLIILGSAIAMKAYSGLIAGVIPAKGFERVPPAEKVITLAKFNV